MPKAFAPTDFEPLDTSDFEPLGATAPKPSSQQQPTRFDKFVTGISGDPLAPGGDPLRRFAEGISSNLGRTTQAWHDMFTGNAGPMTAAEMVPLLGPSAVDAGRMLGTPGQRWQGLGAATGVVAPAVLPEIGNIPVPEPVLKAGAVTKGAAKGAVKGATEMTPVTHGLLPRLLGIPEVQMPAILTRGAQGMAAGRLLGGQTGEYVGAGVGAAAPVVRGAVQGGREALQRFNNPPFAPTAPGFESNAPFVPGQYDAPAPQYPQFKNTRSLPEGVNPPRVPAPAAPVPESAPRPVTGSMARGPQAGFGPSPSIAPPPVETGGAHIPDYQYPLPGPEEAQAKIAAEKKAAKAAMEAKGKPAASIPPPPATQTSPATPVIPPDAQTGPVGTAGPVGASATPSTATGSGGGGAGATGGSSMSGKAGGGLNTTALQGHEQSTLNKIKNLGDYLLSKGGDTSHLDQIIQDPALTSQYLREAKEYGVRQGNPVPKGAYKGLDFETHPDSTYQRLRSYIMEQIEKTKAAGAGGQK